MGFGLSVILLIGLRFVGIFLALALARLAHRPWLGLRFVQAPLPAQYVANSQRPGPPQSLPACHTSHSKGITVYLTESSAQRPALLLSVKRDLHTVLYLYFQSGLLTHTVTLNKLSTLN